MAFGQIELSFVLKKVVVGATNPQILDGGRILMEADSKTAESIVAEVRAGCTEKVNLWAIKSRKERGQLIPISQSTDKEGKTVWKYLLAGDGEFTIVASAGEWTSELDVVIGVEPDPKPPIPPPDPIPPKPIIDVPNEYNVGQISYQTAPKDIDTAKQIATWYRVGASKLFGQGGLADIATIRKQIETQFANKPCPDQKTCEQWDRWNKAVSAALVAEQVKRKVFTRQDFYAALVEVAASLEVVK